MLSLDFVSDWNVDDIDWKSGEVLLVVEGEGATLLPWPEGIVEDFEVCDHSLSWVDFDDTFRLLLKDGSELVPGFALLVKLLLLLCVLVDHLLLVHSHFGQESTDRCGKWILCLLWFFSIVWENGDHHLGSGTGLPDLQE